MAAISPELPARLGGHPGQHEIMPDSLPPTRLYEAITVVIRILALRLGLDALSAGLSRYPSDPSPRTSFILFAVVAVLAYWLWVLSPWIARRITRGQDSALDCGNLTLRDLYSFAFLLVGLYFAVDSFGPTLTWLHYALRHSSSDAPLSQQQQANFYTLFKYLIKLLLGLALVFKGRNLSDRLLRRQNAGKPADP